MSGPISTYEAGSVRLFVAAHELRGVSQFVLDAVAAHEAQHALEIMRAQHGVPHPTADEIRTASVHPAFAPKPATSRPPNRAERRAAMRGRRRS